MIIYISSVILWGGKKTNSANATYLRTIKDLPIQDYKVYLIITVRTFFCKNEECETKTFSETFDFVKSRSRMTNRLEDKIINTSKEMSARKSKKIVNEGLANISDDTILRMLKKSQL